MGHKDVLGLNVLEFNVVFLPLFYQNNRRGSPEGILEGESLFWGLEHVLLVLRLRLIRGIRGKYGGKGNEQKESSRDMCGLLAQLVFVCLFWVEYF